MFVKNIDKIGLWTSAPGSNRLECFQPFMPTLHIEVGKQIGVADEEESSLWVSEGGSHYLFDGFRLVCIAVHSPEYRGWVGRTAVDDIHLEGTVWAGRQAFRNGVSGTLATWEAVKLVFERNVITKYFPPHLSPATLVYGHVERYVRASTM